MYIKSYIFNTYIYIYIYINMMWHQITYNCWYAIKLNCLFRFIFFIFLSYCFQFYILTFWYQLWSTSVFFSFSKGCILPFPKKGDLGLAKNYRGITLTSIAAKIFNAQLWNRIEPKIDNILRKNQNGFRRNRSSTSQILTIRRIFEGLRAKHLQATLLFVDFTKAFDSIHRGKME